MKNLKKIALATAFTGLIASNPASATNFLQNWQIAPDGGGLGSTYLTNVSEFLDIVGPSYIQTSVPTLTGAYTFKEWGALSSVAVDGGAAYANSFTNTNEFTALFNVTGAATLGSSLTFSGGTIDLYSQLGSKNYATATAPSTIYGANDGTHWSTFTVIGGGGSIDPTGIPNGQITLIAKATSLTAGYFFQNGVDLSTLASATNPLLFGFATTNYSRSTNATPAVISDIVHAYAGNAGYANPGKLPSIGVAGEFTGGNNGQYRLSTIPEPSILALLGAGLMAIGLGKRNKKLA